MKPWEVFAAAFAVAAGLWGHLKMLVSWVRSLVLVTVFLDERAAALVVSYIHDGRSRSRYRLFSGLSGVWIDSLERHGSVICENLIGSSRTFQIGTWPVWYRKAKDPVDVGFPHSFSFVRGTIDWEKCMVDAATSSTCSWWQVGLIGKGLRHRVTHHFGKSFVAELGRGAKDEKETTLSQTSVRTEWRDGHVRLLGWKPEEIGKKIRSSSLDDLSLSQDKRDVAREIERWLGAGDWYARRRIPWKRGYQFQGAPGTGKTMFARVVAETLDLPVHVFDLAGMSNADLQGEWRSMSQDVPCMVVLEDVDGVFHGRTNVSPAVGLMGSGGLTFDALLNCIDGVERSDGVLLVVTTNHPELIDPALGDRPGRVDRVVTFGPLGIDERQKLASQIIEDESLARSVALESGDVPAARFVESCCRIALGSLFTDRGCPPLDEDRGGSPGTADENLARVTS